MMTTPSSSFQSSATEYGRISFNSNLTSLQQIKISLKSLRNTNLLHVYKVQSLTALRSSYLQLLVTKLQYHVLHLTSASLGINEVDACCLFYQKSYQYLQSYCQINILLKQSFRNGAMDQKISDTFSASFLRSQFLESVWHIIRGFLVKNMNLRCLTLLLAKINLFNLDFEKFEKRIFTDGHLILHCFRLLSFQEVRTQVKYALQASHDEVLHNLKLYAHNDSDNSYRQTCTFDHEVHYFQNLGRSVHLFLLLESEGTSGISTSDICFHELFTHKALSIFSSTVNIKNSLMRSLHLLQSWSTDIMRFCLLIKYHKSMAMEQCKIKLNTNCFVSRMLIYDFSDAHLLTIALRHSVKSELFHSLAFEMTTGAQSLLKNIKQTLFHPGRNFCNETAMEIIKSILDPQVFVSWLLIHAYLIGLPRILAVGAENSNFNREMSYEVQLYKGNSLLNYIHRPNMLLTEKCIGEHKKSLQLFFFENLFALCIKRIDYYESLQTFFRPIDRNALVSSSVPHIITDVFEITQSMQSCFSKNELYSFFESSFKTYAHCLFDLVLAAKSTDTLESKLLSEIQYKLSSLSSCFKKLLEDRTLNNTRLTSPAYTFQIGQRTSGINKGFQGIQTVERESQIKQISRGDDERDCFTQKCLAMTSDVSDFIEKWNRKSTIKRHGNTVFPISYMYWPLQTQTILSQDIDTASSNNHDVVENVELCTPGPNCYFNRYCLQHVNSADSFTITLKCSRNGHHSEKFLAVSKIQLRILQQMSRDPTKKRSHEVLASHIGISLFRLYHEISPLVIAEIIECVGEGNKQKRWRFAPHNHLAYNCAYRFL